MKILLVDDEELQLLRLEKAVKDAVKDAEILSFSNPLEAFDRCRDEALDLAFLDIEMPGINGIQLAKRLKKARPSINIIFVTAYPQYALEAFSLHASGYLTKPVSKQKVIEELNHLREPIQLPNKKSLQVKCFGNFEVFTPDGERVRFERSKSKELFAYLVHRSGSACTIKEIAAALFEDDPYDKKQLNYIKRERVYGSFSRSFDVSGVEVNDIKASYADGILTLIMPKKAELKPVSRKLAIE
jgi:two-component SAPR family response regulator